MRLLPLLLLAPLAFAQDHWVATWTTAQSLVRPAPPPAPATAQPPTAPPKAPPIGARGFNNQTVRMIVRTSLAGSKVRVTLANGFGHDTVTIGAAHIGLRKSGSEVVAGSDHALMFDGKPSITIRPGAVILSDPVDLNIPAVTDVAVSLFFKGETGPPTTHATALHNTYVKDGDVTGQTSLPESMTTQSYYYLAGIDVVARPKAGVIVAYGDSITDGARSSNEANHSWPALLAARLAADKKTQHVGVANMGIGGNRVLRDGTGASALARLDRDVLSQPGVRWLMLLEGINDIGRGATVAAETVTADELIAAYKQIIERAHSHGISVIGCTLTPYGDAGYARPEGEAVRDAVNNWIRTGKAFDGVVDFEAATRDPQNPKKFRPDFDPGDHLHPNDKGYEAMANAVDLGMFGGKKKRR